MTQGARMYSLEDAEAELVRRECVARGHSFEAVMVTGSNDPVAFVCLRCGESWHVAEPEGAG